MSDSCLLSVSIVSGKHNLASRHVTLPIILQFLVTNFSAVVQFVMCGPPSRFVACNGEVTYYSSGGLSPPRLLLCSEKALDGRAAESATSPQQSTFAEVKNLEDHWTKLDDDRRTQLAQMAMLTRSTLRQLHYISNTDCMYRFCTLQNVEDCGASGLM
jgi:hypothetical protein